MGFETLTVTLTLTITIAMTRTVTLTITITITVTITITPRALECALGVLSLSSTAGALSLQGSLVGGALRLEIWANGGWRRIAYKAVQGFSRECRGGCPRSCSPRT